jgi:hypothetical protein
MRENFFKWFNLKYGSMLLRNILLYPWPKFTGFFDYHLPTSYLKKTFSEVWEEYSEVLEKTCRSRFRQSSDINQYIFRYWQLVKGEFSPIATHKLGVYKELTEDTESICNIIESKKFHMMCINDTSTKNYENSKEKVLLSFAKIAPSKSDFEL